MRVSSSVTSISWIPSEAIAGITRLPFDLHVTHYDDPPPDHIDDIDDLHRRGAFRFANLLRAWVEVEDGRIVDVGQDGRELLSKTLVGLGRMSVGFSPTAFPMLRDPPDWGSESATFTQTAGGRPGVPAPRVVQGRPFVKLEGPNVWTTLSLTLGADGTSTWSLVGASPFPRHWIYDDAGHVVAKAGTIDFKDWYAHAFGGHSPWGGEQSGAVTTAAETPLERLLAGSIMRAGRRPHVRTLAAGDVLTEEGAPGTTVFLVLDGVLSVSVGGSELAQLGPGAVVGERALFEGGQRTATLTAASPCKVVEALEGDLSPDALRVLMEGHRREEP
jgi:hypothetical protein